MDDDSRLFEQLPKGPISEIIIERITSALVDGELKPGDKIPTEVEFSEKLKVGRNSIREAIKVLVAFGVLEIKRSEGTFVTEEFNQNLLNPIIYGMILANKSLDDVIEFKITFLNSVLYLAVPKATDEECRCLRERYDAFRNSLYQNPGNDIEKVYGIGESFYGYLGEITKNTVVMELNEVVLKISKFTRVRAIRYAVASGKIDFLLEPYLKMVELVESRDRARVNDVVDFVLARWKELVQ